MNRAEKTEVVGELKRVFEESESLFLVGFRSVSVPDITELRRRVSDSHGQYRVVKNTLAHRAAEGTVVDQIKDHFEGPTAIAYTREDVVALARVLRDFVKEREGMSFKVGILEGHVISDKQVAGLAEMPSREQLLSKLLFLLNAPLTRFTLALKSPLQRLASVLKQLEEKRNEPSMKSIGLKE